MLVCNNLTQSNEFLLSALWAYLSCVQDLKIGTPGERESLAPEGGYEPLKFLGNMKCHGCNVGFLFSKAVFLPLFPFSGMAIVWALWPSCF